MGNSKGNNKQGEQRDEQRDAQDGHKMTVDGWCPPLHWDEKVERSVSREAWDEMVSKANKTLERAGQIHSLRSETGDYALDSAFMKCMNDYAKALTIITIVNPINVSTVAAAAQQRAETLASRFNELWDKPSRNDVEHQELEENIARYSRLMFQIEAIDSAMEDYATCRQASMRKIKEDRDRETAANSAIESAMENATAVIEWLTTEVTPALGPETPIAEEPSEEPAAAEASAAAMPAEIPPSKRRRKPVTKDGQVSLFSED
jgi:hypothetical protein